ncbi:MAG: hypothetical protein Q8Q74_22185 [Polaromonas sp.]|jgi:hypothetical protein|uniref:hypothetical protein n=1 Tax=unclassified Polaromonas TaxID=2638319 RepID=UPI000BD870B0|nr:MULTISPECIES: hypothetical protein [unclassified Polaromonas]MDP2449101.1 hypothetical protein [Polaromonas sp.]MDP3829269.1 hypothetical protein [Polaromonas sp.]OYY32492.1 MAG: hypothetical protein B7Y60_22240 [Polaromonas sp. 35-63-35]OYZ15997.1 MAG: hypothetical protein B7Y28_21750 [Polaromonas sp. 16-63-31]OYZ75831.1 MAG: hypothetical protein B7Y09_22855 [Polaromonas sp. 24-63-21]
MTDQFSFNLAFEPQGNYTLRLASGATEAYPTLGDMMVGLNRTRRDPEARILGLTGSTKATLKTGECCEIVQAHNHLGIRLPSEDGNCQALIDAYLDEVEPYGKDTNGRVKHPWEMTQGEWGALTSFGSVLYGVIPWLSPTQRAQTCVTAGAERCGPLDYGLDLFRRRMGFGHNGPTYDGENTNSRHEVHVGYALAAGKPVPQAVIDEYLDQGEEVQYRDPWFEALLAKPFLRGRVSRDRLAQLVTLLDWRGDGLANLTEEVASHAIEQIARLPASAGPIEVDNELYLAGILKVRTLNDSLSASDIGTPHNEFAATVRDLLVAEHRIAGHLRVQKALDDGNMTFREAAFARLLADSTERTATYCHANRLAKAIEAGDIGFLLDTLDGTGNDISKKAIESFFQTKLRNVKAAERRKAIFALAGHVTEQQMAAAEAELKVRREASHAAREVIAEAKRKKNADDHAKWKASSTKYKFEGKIMTGAEFVELIVSRGFLQLRTRKVGAVTHHYLGNTATSESYRLRVNDGTLDYAKLVLDRQTETV